MTFDIVTLFKKVRAGRFSHIDSSEPEAWRIVRDDGCVMETHTSLDAAVARCNDLNLAFTGVSLDAHYADLADNS